MTSSAGEDAPPRGPAARVRFVTRDGCHLCEEARAVLAAVCAELGERFEEVDVDEDPALLATYDEQVPVTFVDGRQHDFWRVDARRLRQALSRDPGDRGRVG